jgi:hypothetical protein
VSNSSPAYSMPEFTKLYGTEAHHAFDFGKFAGRYLAAIAYRFNRGSSSKPYPSVCWWLRWPLAHGPRLGCGWRKILANEEKT